MDELRIFQGLFLAIVLSCAFAASNRALGELRTDRPLVIAHRGCSGQLPEHTVEAYQLAVDQGADVIECDLAVTKDLQFVCSHEPWLNQTTDVAQKFPDRFNSYFIPSELGFKKDYFTIDFTLEELKTLRKVQTRSYRDQSYNGKFAMASFEDNIAVAQNATRPVGIYPETKAPEFFNNFLETYNTTMEDLLLEFLTKHGYTEKSAPCFIQSFDIRSLQYLSDLTQLKLVFLTSTAVPNSQLESMASYISGIGPSKSAIVQVDPVRNTVVRTTDFIDRAHNYNFTVHPYTFRNEYQFLAYDYGSDPYKEYEQFYNLGVDGYFTDFPGSAVNYLQLLEVEETECPTDGATETSPNLFFAVVMLVTLQKAVSALQ